MVPSSISSGTKSWIHFIFVGLVFWSVGYFLGAQTQTKQDVSDNQFAFVHRLTKEGHPVEGLSKLVPVPTAKYTTPPKPPYTSVAPITRGMVGPGNINLTMDDPELIAYARTRLLKAPNWNIPVNLSQASVANPDQSQFDQVRALRRIFRDVIKSKNLNKGFFIEVGAFDGEYLSNSLWFERKWNWTGLLIESNSDIYARLVTKNRRAWIANTCLSTTEQAGFLNYYESANLTHDLSYAAFNGLVKLDAGGQKVEKQMFCVPLYTLLLAINQTVIDFFSLDIEGAELDVLQTIPFENVRFKILMVETNNIPGDGTKRVKLLLNKRGYKLYKLLDIDSIYVHEDFVATDFAEPPLTSK